MYARSKVLLILILVAVLATMSFAVIAQDDDEITLTFTQWIPPTAPAAERFVQIAAAYSDLNPNVTVQFDFIPFGDYTSTLPLRLSGSNPPDAGWLVENVAATWLASGILADVGEVLRGDPDYDFADLSEPAMGLWVDGDSVFGVPFSTSPFIMIYNRDIFAAAGVDAPDVMIENGEYTWENLAEALRVIVSETGQNGLAPPDSGLYSGERVWHTLIPVIRAYGSDAWDADYNCLMNEPEAVEAIELFHSMIFEDRTVEQPGQILDFPSGNVAAMIGQLSRVAPLADAEFDWDIAPLPAGPAGETTVIGQAAFVVFNNSPNRDVAIDFLKFLTNQENTLAIAQFFPPIRASVLETDVLLDANPTVAPESMRTAVIAPILEGLVLPTHPNYPTIDLTARPILDQLWQPGADVQAIMDNLCNTIQPLLDS